MLPDIDEPGSSVAHECGVISYGVSWVVNKVSDGHRMLTHALHGVGIIALALVLLATGLLTSTVVFCVLAAGTWRTVEPWFTRLCRLRMFVRIGGGYAFYHFHPFSGLLLIGFLSLGWLTHRAGDLLTSAGISLRHPNGS
ncbi:metal-dependent hydrolase [Ferrimicrobium sp.]|uniref:metal-dependent hydrolase n=1 Tax=Ferrimicrobium sp. TaxID=2926050 RepID=UPI0026151799|nr:metal-dependent hydrolase [Ferrimicrobium sp.]